MASHERAEAAMRLENESRCPLAAQAGLTEYLYFLQFASTIYNPQDNHEVRFPGNVLQYKLHHSAPPGHSANITSKWTLPRLYYARAL